ncbi:MAG: hypothetical protein HY904_04700 [Deltaproteobacteria bacterium]|nr:hypothetical protein [Deltaproteobacteria bacterium]
MLIGSSFPPSALRAAYQPTSSLSGVQAQMAQQILSMLADSFARSPSLARNPLGSLLPAPAGYRPMEPSMLRALAGSQQALLGNPGFAGTAAAEIFNAMGMFNPGNYPVRANAFAHPGIRPDVPVKDDPVITRPTTPGNPTTPTGPDRFATTSTCRTNKANPTNLNNSPHIKLALHNILSDSKGKRMTPKKLAEELDRRYGIKAEETTVKDAKGKTHKALKFENGDIFCDGNGNGVMDLKDYNFKGAIDDIKQRYGVEANDDGVRQLMQQGVGGGQLQAQQAPPDFNRAFQPLAGNGSFFPAQDIARLFSMAWGFAA